MFRLKPRDRILVTGSTGFIGSSLLKRLHLIPCRLTAIVHDSSPRARYKDVTYIQADLTRPEDCKRVVQGVDYIFHCAANTSGAAVMQATPLVHVTPNILMNLHLFEAAYNADVKKVVWISSGAIYPPSDEPVKEDFSGPPFSKYFAVAHMKRYTETLAELFSYWLPKQLPIVVVRPSNVYGPYDKFDPDKSHVTAALVRKVVERMDPLEVWGSGEDERDLIYIADFITGLLLAFEKLDAYDPINIGSGCSYSVNQILQELLKLEGFSPKIVYNIDKPTTIPRVVLDVAKTETLLGFKAEISLTVGLKLTLNWYKSNLQEVCCGNKQNAV